MHQKVKHQDQYPNLSQQRTFCLNGYSHYGTNDSHDLDEIGFDGITTDNFGLDSLDSEASLSRFPVLLPASHSASQLLQRVFAKSSLVECSACTLRNFEQDYDFVFHKRFEVTCVSSTKDLLPEDRFVQICASKTHLRILPKWSKMLGSYLPKLINTERFLLLKKTQKLSY